MEANSDIVRIYLTKLDRMEEKGHPLRKGPMKAFLDEKVPKNQGCGQGR